MGCCQSTIKQLEPNVNGEKLSLIPNNDDELDFENSLREINKNYKLEELICTGVVLGIYNNVNDYVYDIYNLVHSDINRWLYSKCPNENVYNYNRVFRIIIFIDSVVFTYCCHDNVEIIFTIFKR